jgi:hypothetical protein
MHIHKPKAPHGLGEFLREIGVIVCGVLIAIALDQTVEALRHRAEAKEMIGKLREESIENRHVLDHDLIVCRRGMAEADTRITFVAGALRQGRLPDAKGVAPMPTRQVQGPADSAWITVRDSALLPIMPKLTVDNYGKLDSSFQGLVNRQRDTVQARRRLAALINTAQERPMDTALANDLLEALNLYREYERGYCNLVHGFRIDNEVVLAGTVLDRAAVAQAAEPPTDEPNP